MCSVVEQNKENNRRPFRHFTGKRLAQTLSRSIKATAGSSQQAIEQPAYVG